MILGSFWDDFGMILHQPDVRKTGKNGNRKNRKKKETGETGNLCFYAKVQEAHGSQTAVRFIGGSGSRRFRFRTVHGSSADFNSKLKLKNQRGCKKITTPPGAAAPGGRRRRRRHCCCHQFPMKTNRNSSKSIPKAMFKSKLRPV